MKKLNVLYIFILISLTGASFSYGSELKTEYQNSYPKYYLTDNKDKKEVVGLCIDMIKAVEKKLPEIKIISNKGFIPFKRIQANLYNGKIDVFFGFAKNRNRLKKYIFIDIPLYEVNHVIAVRRDDNIKINTFDDIRKLMGDNRILTNFGTATENFLNKQGGLEVDSGGKDLTKNLIKLILKRGRFVYFHDIGLISTIKRDLKKTDIKILPTSFRKYHHYVAFSRKVPKKVIEKFVSAIKKLSNNGDLKRIQEKYTKF